MSETCEDLHRFFNRLPRLRFPFDRGRIPLNGIYILFQGNSSALGQ